MSFLMPKPKVQYQAQQVYTAPVVQPVTDPAETVQATGSAVRKPKGSTRTAFGGLLNQQANVARKTLLGQ